MLATRSNRIEAIAPQLRVVPSASVARTGVEERLTAFAIRHSALALRISFGVIYLGFGALKLAPGASPAEHLAGETLRTLSAGILRPAVGLPLLGLYEMAIGLAVLVAPRARFTVPALLLHLLGTLTPFALFPHQTFAHFPVPSLVGQYILKNLVLVAAGLALLRAPGNAE